MKNQNSILSALCILIFSLSQLYATAQSGEKLSGKILNQRNQPIAGATVSVKGAKSVPANSDGGFVITVAVGTHIVTVSAVGYQTKEVTEVVVKAGADNVLDIVLTDKKSELGEVIVSSSRRQENTTALLTFQKNNTALSSGLAADFIRRTPDKNMGEILRRVSGASIQDNKFVIVRGLSDRYNAAMINGAQMASTEPDKKAFSFDIIPSQLIDNIIINKTATPELTGEFAGGLVQVTTKDIPVKNLLSVGASFGFNTQSFGKDFYSNKRGNTDWVGFDDGQRKLPSSYPAKYGDYNRLTPDEKYSVSRDFNDEVYNEVKSTAGPIQQYNVTWANASPTKKGGAFGTILGITYRNSKLVYPDVDRQVFDFDGSGLLDYVDQQNRYSTTVGALASIAYTKGKTKVSFKNMFNQLFEDNYYHRTGLNVESLQDVQMRSSVLNQRSLYTGQLEARHQFKNNFKFIGNFNYSFNHKEQPDLRVQSYGKTIGTSNAYSLNNRGNNTNRFWSDLTDQGIGYSVKLEMPFQMKGLKQVASVGFGSLARVRDFGATIMGVSDPGTASLFFEPYNTIFKKENFNPNGFQYITDLQNVNDHYVAASALSNGYFMFDNKLGEKWRLVWGARGEYFEQVVETNSTKDLEVDTEKFDLLPSANLTFSPNTKTNLRLAASRTVARPEFREVAPFAFFDFEEMASTVGNPALERSSIINGDVRYEWYPKSGEVLSLGGFVKSFDAPIELRLNSASAPTRRQYQFQNAESAILYGAELELRKSLGFLSGKEGWADRLYFNGNASFIFSEVTLKVENPSGVETGKLNRPLQGQSPYLVNGGFQYDGTNGFNLSLMYNIIGQRLRFVGNDTYGDIYEKPRNLLDFQVSKKVFNNRGEVRLTVGDILNQDVLLYEKPVTKSATAYDKNIDRIFLRFTPGTTFTVGFNYDISLK
ncbi:MAG TPA: TonB-dependent receptor [Phnomibacter sp.]|nr:TonB-dependent receptor [Phnomibacter sp.]